MAAFIAGMITLWWVLPSSFIICITACTLAMEGAVLFAPAFLFLFPLISSAFPELTANEAIGVALFIGVFGFGSASIGYIRQGVVDKGIAFRLLMITVPFAFIARLISFQIQSNMLFILFGVVLFLLAGVVFRSYLAHNKVVKAGIRQSHVVDSADATHDASESQLVARDGRRYNYAYHLGWLDRFYTAFAGALVGLIGVGVGEIVNTSLMIRHSLPMRVATGTAVIVVTATVLTASVTHLGVVAARGGDIVFEWTLVALAVPAVMVGGQIAPHVSAKFSESVLKRVLMFMFVFTGAIMVFRGIVS